MMERPEWKALTCEDHAERVTGIEPADSGPTSRWDP